MTPLSPAPAKKSRLRLTLGDVALTLGITVGAILALEGGASALLFLRDVKNTDAPKRMVRPRTTPDTLLGWRNESNANRADGYGKGIGFHTDARGFRRTSLGDSIPASAKTIVCSGDAYTLGVGVADEHAWCAQLQRTLPGFRTVNMGQDFYGLDQAYLLYRREAAATPHQVQILAITNSELERSISDDDAGWPKPKVEVKDGRLETEDVPVPAATPSHYRKSAIGRRFGDLRIVQAVRRVPSFDPAAERSQQVDAMRGTFERMIADLEAAHQAAGTQLVVAYLPSTADINGLDDRRAWLSGAMKKQGVPFLDLTPALRAMRKDSLDAIYFARWSPVQPGGAIGQLSKVGNTWVAREIGSQIAPLLSPRP